MQPLLSEREEFFSTFDVEVDLSLVNYARLLNLQPNALPERRLATIIFNLFDPGFNELVLCQAQDVIILNELKNLILPFQTRCFPCLRREQNDMRQDIVDAALVLWYICSVA